MLILALVLLRRQPVFHPFRLRSPQVTFTVTFVTIFLIFPGRFPAAGQSASQPILITADLTDAPRKLIHADMEMPVTPGPATLTAAKWIPGNHRPSGPIDNFTG